MKMRLDFACIYKIEMSHKTLPEQLNEWHEAGKHEKIAETLLAMPQDQLDYEMANKLARALNNLSRYEEGLSLLESVREQGQDDPFWNFRVGYSLYYIDGREVEAIPYLERAIELGDDYPAAYELLLNARSYLENDSPETENGEPEPEMSFTPMSYACVSLNMRLQPKHRHDIEDTLDFMLRSKGFGCISGGGTLLSSEGEPKGCDIEIDLVEDSEEVRQNLTSIMRKLEVAKGSKLKYRSAASGSYESECQIGGLDGLAVYLNGTDLPDEIYEQHDINDVYSELLELLRNNGALTPSYWQGPQETALYFYGEGGFEMMLEKIQPYLNEHPLCQQSRVVCLTQEAAYESAGLQPNLYKWIELFGNDKVN